MNASQPRSKKIMPAEVVIAVISGSVAEIVASFVMPLHMLGISIFLGAVVMVGTLCSFLLHERIMRWRQEAQKHAR